jgi:hypothetical protein
MKRHEPANCCENSSLYARIPASAPRCARVSAGRWSATRIGVHSRYSPLDGTAKIFLKALEWRVDHPAARDDDNVDARLDDRELRAPKDISNQSFSTVSRYRVAQLSRGHDTQPDCRDVVRRDDKSKETAVNASAHLEGSLVLAAAPYAASLPEALAGHVAIRPGSLDTARGCGCEYGGSTTMKP